MLKCTTTRPYGMFPDSKPKEPMCDMTKYTGLKNLPKDYCVSSNIYLHGEIEDMAGFDIPIWLDGDFDVDFTDGVHDCEIIIGDKHVEGKMYCWRFNKGKIMDTDNEIVDYVKINGYIITHDSESKDFVEKQYEEKQYLI